MPLAERLTRWLEDHPVIELGILFGSLDGGRPRFDSDLDLAVMARRPFTAGERKAAIEALAALGGRPVDLVDLQATHGPLLRQILRTGTRLHCAADALYGRLVSRHMFEQTDWAPYRRRILEERRSRWIRSS